MEFFEHNGRYVELKDDKTWAEHFVEFRPVFKDQWARLDTDPVTKVETQVLFKVKNSLVVEKATGDIKTIRRDFNAQREILGAEVHPDPLFEHILVEAAAYPSDVQAADGTMKYRYDKVTKTLVRKV